MATNEATTVFRLLSSPASGGGAHIAEDVFCEYLSPPLLPDLGVALWRRFVERPAATHQRAAAAEPSRTPKPRIGLSLPLPSGVLGFAGAASQPPAASAPADAPRMSHRVFVRGVAALVGEPSAERRLEELFDVLLPAPGGGAAAHAAASARAAAERDVAAVLARAYTLDTGAAPADVGVFRCAAMAAAPYFAAAVLDDEPAAPARTFARWAAGALPGLTDVLRRHVERLCASQPAIGSAMDTRERRGLGEPPPELTLGELLRLDSDALRAHLARANRRATPRDGGSAPEPLLRPAEGAPDPAAVGAAGADASPDAAPAAAAATPAEGGRSGPSSGPAAGSAEGGSLLGAEALWVLRLALELRTPDADGACDADEGGGGAAGRGEWSCLFDSRVHGCSLHTLVDRTAGYGDGATAEIERGQLLVCAASGHVFGLWADRGLAPTASADFSGSEGCALVRLRPSLLVCRSRRKLAASAADGAAQHAASLVSRASSAASARRRGEAVAAPTDANFVLVSNKRGHRRGISIGGTLAEPRLFLAPSLERGASGGACDTFEEGLIAPGEEFALDAVEVWACGGRAARRAQSEWREGQAEQRRRTMRAFLKSEVDGEEKGVVDGMGKEDKWMMSLMRFTGKFGQADAY